MDSVKLFDAQAALGPCAPGSGVFISADDVEGQWRRLGISGGLFRYGVPNRAADLPYDNDRLYGMVEGRPGMVPCPAVAPSAGSELPPEGTQVDEALRRGAGAAWIRPEPDAWSTEPWCADALFGALADRKLPVFCQMEQVALTGVGELAERYPGLPFMVSGVPYTAMRSVVALLKAFSNIYLCLGSPWCVHGGIEFLIGHGLASRLLFGTGFPEAEAGAALGYLAYADIPMPEKSLIASENFARLAAEIRR
ncbi:MAG: amidohydrolase family protein [Spirochaetes bacterium]|nr:amidohydrolase family protein [Spirochaetota bacterium]